MSTASSEADELARRAAEAMWADDRTSQAFGMRLAEVGAGRAVLEMRVTAAMSNGHGQCHGGNIFTLADSAFGYACNSYNRRMVAQHCSVTYIRPGRVGDLLTARAVERSRSGRSGIYDVTVTGSDGLVVAEFRGHCRMIEGTLVE